MDFEIVASTLKEEWGFAKRKMKNYRYLQYFFPATGYNFLNVKLYHKQMMLI